MCGKFETILDMRETKVPLSYSGGTMIPISKVYYGPGGGGVAIVEHTFCWIATADAPLGCKLCYTLCIEIYYILDP